ncbi:MAG: hypothetical protein ACK40O_14245, partial [Allosphingosinicella sp.]
APDLAPEALAPIVETCVAHGVAALIVSNTTIARDPALRSAAKAEAMRQERMRAATIDDKLQDLISKSDVIVKLLQGQLDLLNNQKTRVEANLASTLTEREETVGALEAVRAEIAAMDPKIIELENRIAVEQDAAARTKLETELATLNAQYNALVQDEQVKLAKSQTLERYIEKGKT